VFLQEQKWRKLIGARVVVESRGEGTLLFYGLVKKSRISMGKKMCGIVLDDRVVRPFTPPPPPPLLLPLSLVLFVMQRTSHA
jgi:hypothetical protein